MNADRPPTAAAAELTDDADREALAWKVLAGVADPELPVLSVVDLGVVRRVHVDGGRVDVTLTPTFSGCPATEVIAADVRAALAVRFAEVSVRHELAPAWGSDDLRPQAFAKLRAAGIAAPSAGPPACPRCGAADPELLSPFGSAPCRALWRCTACREPFDAVKRH